MPFSGTYRLSCLAAFLFAAVLLWASCKKDYSYEGGNPPVVPPPPVPVPAPPGVAKYPYCASCAGKDGMVMGRWSFKVDTTLFCGRITDAVVSPEKTGFTFFGPSECSEDTGLIMTAFLPVPLTVNRTNVVTQRAALQYYDRTTFIDVFAARTASGMTLNLDSYEHTARTASGRFSGYVYTKGGELVQVKEGKFVITFSN